MLRSSISLVYRKIGSLLALHSFGGVLKWKIHQTQEIE